jgi:hypothetical protein
MLLSAFSCRKTKTHRQLHTGDGLVCTGLTKISGQLSRASVGTHTTAATTLATHLAEKAHSLFVS